MRIHPRLMGISGFSIFAAFVLLELPIYQAYAVAAADTSANTQAPADSSGLEEIVVTATRREQSSLNSALALDVFSGDELRTYSVQSLTDLSKIEPSVAVQNFGVSQQQLIIRGISSNVGATSGLYLDEAPLLGGFQNNLHGDGTPGLRLYDVERIEVLKGPQGTLFGSGSMSGTLRIITNKPDVDQWSASIEGSAAHVQGGERYLDGDAMINIPLVKDTLAIRVVGWEENGGGFIDQTLNGLTYHDVNHVDLKGGRVMALWRVLDRLNVTASVNYQDGRTNGPQWWTVEDSPYENNEPSKNPFRQTYLLYNLTAEYGLDFGTVTAVYNRGKAQTLQPEDSSPTNCELGHLCVPFFPALTYVPLYNYRDWTSELRFSSKFSGPAQIVAGAYYQQDDSDYSGIAVYDNASGEAACFTIAQCDAADLRQPGSNFTPAGFRNYVEFGSLTDQDVKQHALYAQGDLQLLEPLTATLGIRYFAATLSNISYSTQDLAPGPTTPCNWVVGCVTTAYQTFSGVSEESKTTYNAALLYKFTPQVTAYVRIASGFRLGGVNPAYAAAVAFGDHTVPRAYDPDSLWDYEIGTKAYLFDRKLYLDLSYYHIDWSAQQVNAESAGAFAYTLNAGKTKSDGVEFDARFKPIAQLTLSGGATYVKAVLAETLPASVAAAGDGGNVGDRVPLVPRWSASLGGDYRVPLSGSLQGYSAATVTYRGDSATGFNSSDAFYYKLPSYALVDLKFGATLGRYDVNLYAQNLTNKVAIAGEFANSDGARLFSPPPRTVGIHVAAQF